MLQQLLFLEEGCCSSCFFWKRDAVAVAFLEENHSSCLFPERLLFEKGSVLRKAHVK